ncbi:hypothetical protein SCP_0102260 [Sparassis crispa]|uniref:37S ribosomal protein n=1 Tax=Sparassis crispa TaxID=139825 RepID=A0A401G5B7_9APHY|nr:hypothetical protein SCP_0102260 [Sparassis crispa]GBE77353.1 hypothetical protein SCP_0102260 [Sparassis crispa]
MLRAKLTRCPRVVASSSSLPASLLHTSPVLQSFRKRRSRVQEQANLSKRQERERLEQTDRPHIVLGTRPSTPERWENSDLAKILVTEKDILDSPVMPLTPTLEHDIQTPTYYNYGLGAQERELLFETLPVLSVEGTSMRRPMDDPKQLLENHKLADEHERRKTVMLARLVDLRNANARGIAFENRRRIISEFSESGKPNDTGRSEVQAALLTLQIRNLWDHLNKYKKDISNRRSLRRLVHQRAKILKYLKRVDQDRYDNVLERLGLEPESVEGELVV